MSSFSNQQNWVVWARGGVIQNIAHPLNMAPPVCRASSIRPPCVYYFFLAVVVRHETTAITCWALPFIVRTFFNDTITVAVWTGFHVRGSKSDHVDDVSEHDRSEGYEKDGVTNGYLSPF
jgi:hypothetical protein